MREARGRLGRIARPVAALAITVSLVAGVTAVAAARPSKADLDAAKAKLAQFDDRLSLLVEQYDQAQVDLQRARVDLRNAQAAADRAQREAAEARAQLSKRAVAAYEGDGSQIDALLGATTFADFSDRLEFINRVAQQDADLASRAENKRQEALRAGERLKAALSTQRTLLAAIQAKTAEIKSGISQQESMVSQLEKELAKPLNPKPKRVPVPQQITNSAPNPPAGGSGSGNGDGSGSGSGNGNGSGDGGGSSSPPPPPPPTSPPPPPPPPPPPSSAASIAVQAAYSAIGTPYLWGGADPSTGFDCSGLTMWSWAQAGVSLPHSSAMQYAVLPHVSSSDLQPGDLVFFYSPIHHVAIYVGNGMMIHAPHTGSYVQLTSFWSYPSFVGAARPG